MVLDMTVRALSHLSFGHLDRAPVLRSGVALHVKAPLHNAAVVPLAVDHVGMLQRCNPPIIPLPEYLSAVSPRNRVHRVLQIAGVVSIVRQEKKALGVVIELSLRSRETIGEYDGNDVAVNPGGSQSVEDGPPSYKEVSSLQKQSQKRTPFVLRCHQLSGPLVCNDNASSLNRGQTPPIHAHLVLVRHVECGRCHNHSVQRDATISNQLLRFSPRAYPAASNPLCDPHGGTRHFRGSHLRNSMQYA